MHDLQCLKPYCSIGEAAAIEAVLEDSGVRCQISEEAGGVWGVRFGHLGAVRVLVAEEDLVRATEILQSREQACQEEPEDADQEGYWNSPEAFAPFQTADKGDEDVKGARFSELIIAALIAFIGIPFFTISVIVAFRTLFHF